MVDDSVGRDHVEGSLAVPQPTPVEHAKTRCREGVLRPAKTAIARQARAARGGASDLLEVPAEFVECGRRERCCQLVSEGDLKPSRQLRRLLRKQQPQRPSRQRAEQGAIPLQYGAEVRVKRAPEEVH